MAALFLRGAAGGGGGGGGVGAVGADRVFAGILPKFPFSSGVLTVLLFSTLV